MSRKFCAIRAKCSSFFLSSPCYFDYARLNTLAGKPAFAQAAFDPAEGLSLGVCSVWTHSFESHLRTALLFAMIKKFREYSFLLLRYHCERSQSGRG